MEEKDNRRLLRVIRMKVKWTSKASRGKMFWKETLLSIWSVRTVISEAVTNVIEKQISFPVLMPDTMKDFRY